VRFESFKNFDESRYVSVLLYNVITTFKRNSFYGPH